MSRYRKYNNQPLAHPCPLFYAGVLPHARRYPSTPTNRPRSVAMLSAARSSLALRPMPAAWASPVPATGTELISLLLAFVAWMALRTADAIADRLLT